MGRKWVQGGEGEEQESQEREMRLEGPGGGAAFSQRNLSICSPRDCLTRVFKIADQAVAEKGKPCHLLWRFKSHS